MCKALQRRVIIAMTGASGVAYGVRILELLAEQPGVETHLVISSSGAVTIRQELGRELSSVAALADVVYRPADVGASLASGSFETAGMIVSPCSIKTLSAIANCYSNNLVTRAADVCLKEGRPLILMVRESPLHLGHLRLMAAATEAGAVIAPPVPALYMDPASVNELIDHTCRRVLARVGIPLPDTREWQGVNGKLPGDPKAGDSRAINGMSS